MKFSKCSQIEWTTVRLTTIIQMLRHVASNGEIGNV
jgi:hypothetical protein